MMIRMLVFDCDGTLVDTSCMITCLYEGYHRFYPNRPALPYAHFIPCFAFDTARTHQYLQIPPQDQAAFDHLCFGPSSSFHTTIHAYDGIKEVIQTLHQRGYCLAVATNRSFTSWKEVEAQLGAPAFSCFHYIAASDRIAHPKPAPDALFYLMERSGFTRSELLMIGDSMADALCAKQAELPFVWASWSGIQQELLPHTFHLHEVSDLLTLCTG